jgi:sugar phosphate isomerase/epimerase
MWLPGGRLNDRELNAVLQEGKELEACYVKVSLGWYDAGRSELNELKRLLSESIGDARSTGQPIRLMVENDQTMHGGNAEILKRFLERCAVEAVPVRMIFDIGNWHWVGESPMRAANMLAEYVDCIHCKQAQAGEDGWTAVPLSEAPEAEWREVLSCFPRELPRVIEFPITEPPLESTAGKYVRLLSEA